MQILNLCSHANVGWPIRCDGEAVASQRCCDCGAQRTFVFRPRLRKGPWKHVHLSALPRVDVAFILPRAVLPLITSGRPRLGRQ
jgi:hypothetical protein